MGDKKTLVIGASANPARYSNLAIHSLRQKGYEVVALAKRTAQVADVQIVTEFPASDENIDTITMYVGPRNQPEYYQPILSLQPKRVIFNPGTENPELMDKLKENGVEVTVACTLLLLSTGQY